MRKKQTIECAGDVCRVYLTNKIGQIVGEGIFDEKHHNLVKSGRWCKDSVGYLVMTKNYKRYRLHTLILPKKQGYEIDHINGNKLDNREANLRYATHRQNLRNMNGPKRGLTEMRGIRLRVFNRSQKWSARIMVDYKEINLGVFNTKDEAIRARLKAEQEHFGEFAPRRSS